MTRPLQIKTLELLSSRICHDMISPISAINNGLELFEEMGPDAGDEVTDLIGHAARQSSRKLQLMRFAYGAGGNDPSIRPEQVFGAFSGFLEGDHKTEFIKPDMNEQQNLMGIPSINRMMACALFMAHECLPRGGEIRMTCPDGERALIELSPTDEKIWMSFKTKMGQAEADEEDIELDPKTVHPYVTGLFAESYGYKISMSDVQDTKAAFTVIFPQQPDE